MPLDLMVFCVSFWGMASDLPAGWARGSGEFEGQLWNGKKWVDDPEFQGVDSQPVDEGLKKRASRLKFFAIACWVGFVLAVLGFPGRPQNALLGYVAIGISVWVFFSSRSLRKRLVSDGPTNRRRKEVRQVREAYGASLVLMVVFGAGLLLFGLFLLLGSSLVR